MALFQANKDAGRTSRVISQILFLLLTATVLVVTACVATVALHRGGINNNDLSPGDLYDTLSGDKNFYRGVNYEFDTSMGGSLSTHYVDIMMTNTEVAIQIMVQRSGSPTYVVTYGGWWRYGERLGDCEILVETEPYALNVTTLMNFCESPAAKSCERVSVSSGTEAAFAVFFLWLLVLAITPLRYCMESWRDESPAQQAAGMLFGTIIATVLLIVSMAKLDSICVDDMMNYLSTELKASSADMGEPVAKTGGILAADAASIALSLLVVILILVISQYKLYEPIGDSKEDDTDSNGIAPKAPRQASQEMTEL